MTCAAHCREIEKREARISWLEAEVQRQGNIITDLADMNAKWDVRYNALLAAVEFPPTQPSRRAMALAEWRTRFTTPIHPSKVKPLETSIGILEGRGGTAPRAE